MTVSNPVKADPTMDSGPETLHLPRILCLHGGGVSARIFHMQARRLMKELSPYFRLVFVDGPFTCNLHPDVMPYYGSMGPGRRWSAWLTEHELYDAAATILAIEHALFRAMQADLGTGPWVGLMGFSQGAKMAMSILLENQLRREERKVQQSRALATTIATAAASSSEAPATLPTPTPHQWFAGVDWGFGVMLAGRAKPASLSHRSRDGRYFDLLERLPTTGDTAAFPHRMRLRTPTLHVHGTRDGGLKLHRQMLRDYTAPASTRLVEWDEAHRVPVKTDDVLPVVDGILEVARVSSLLGAIATANATVREAHG